MTQQRLETLSEVATKAHARIQQDYTNIDPIVGISRNMRSNGFPADVMTIDCLKSGKRIILILHDEQPELISFQFTYKDESSDGTYQSTPFERITDQTLYDWISDYFCSATA